MNISNFIPRPVRDLLITPVPRSIEEQAKPLNESERRVVTIGRLALAAIAVSAVVFAGTSPLVTLVLGVVVSLPAVGIVVGSGLLYYGATSIIHSLASGSLISLGIGLAAGAVGAGILENHDENVVGFLERARLN